jgi:hypothetical protein
MIRGRRRPTPPFSKDGEVLPSSLRLTDDSGVNLQLETIFCAVAGTAGGTAQPSTLAPIPRRLKLET